MFCPKCATKNVEGASFCRVCGANISLIPHALSGELPAAQKNDGLDRDSRRRHRRGRPPSLEEGIRSLAMSIAFFVVSILVGKYAPAGKIWWFWMLIPAFTFLGKGIAEIIRVNQARKAVTQPESRSQISGAGAMNTLPPRQTGELITPVPSVTEGTTRHLGAEAPTRHFDPRDSQKLP